MRHLVACIAIIAWMVSGAHAIGTEQVLVPDRGSRPLALRIWFPDAEATQGEHLPLVVISHGTGGDSDGHADTAEALANAGFVVVGVMHTGDNYKDNSAVVQGRHLALRPRQVSHGIDYMMGEWHAHGSIDPARIGVFGFSSGGFTALILAGGKPDLSRVAPHCRQQPGAWDCEYLAGNGISAESIQPVENAAGDARIKATVVAAPAVAYSFEPQGLASVRIPVQLWGAQRDEIIDDGAAVVQRLLPTAPEYHLVDNAGHYSFIRPCGGAFTAMIAVMRMFGTEPICSDPEGFDRQQFHARFNADVVRFFRANLVPNPTQK